MSSKPPEESGDGKRFAEKKDEKHPFLEGSKEISPDGCLREQK